MEMEDVEQELTVALIEAIIHIKDLDNEAKCFSYLQKSIINKYYYLCKSNIKEEAYINRFEEINDLQIYKEKYNYIELYVDMKSILKDKNSTQQHIIQCVLIEHLSDREISLKLHVSRQYVNRIKKNILNEIPAMQLIR